MPLSPREDLYLSPETPTAQAQRVFKLLCGELERTPRIALLYAANNDQVQGFIRDYQKQRLHIPLGAGQALFFNAFNQLVNQAVESGALNFGQIVVLPIATSLHGGDNRPGNQVTKQQLDRDINNIEDHLEQGYCVYGFGQKASTHNQSRYYIGGGVSKGFYMTSGGYPNIDNKSQGEYLHDCLHILEQQYQATVAQSTATVQQAPDIESQPIDEPTGSNAADTQNETKLDLNELPEPSEPARKDEPFISSSMAQSMLLTASVLLLLTGIYLASMTLIVLGVICAALETYLYFSTESTTSLKI